MTTAPMHLIIETPSGDAAMDTAISSAILRRVSDAILPETLQVGLPHRTVAFGKHDAITDGFSDAVQIAEQQGFDPTIRIAGGRAVVFHPGVIRFAWTVPAEEPLVDIHERFAAVARRVVTTLAAFGAEGHVGELPDEYCPGTYSVSIPGTGKVMGSGQRLARHSAQVGGMIVLDDAASINTVLVPVYESLGLAMDPLLTGAVSDAVDFTTREFVDVFTSQFTEGREVNAVDLDDATREAAAGLRDQHDARRPA